MAYLGSAGADGGQQAAVHVVEGHAPHGAAVPAHVNDLPGWTAARSLSIEIEWVTPMAQRERAGAEWGEITRVGQSGGEEAVTEAGTLHAPLIQAPPPLSTSP